MADKVEPGAEGTEETPVVRDDQPTAETTNAAAKKLPWVQEALQAKAELARMQKAQDDAKNRAEREQAEAKGEYEKALQLEKDRVKQLESETLRLGMETEFVKAGAVDPRAIKIFESEYNADTESLAEFVARVKADDANALYFTNPDQRTPLPAPPASGGVAMEMTPDTWEKAKNSDDPKIRLKAAEYASRFWNEHGRSPGR